MSSWSEMGVKRSEVLIVNNASATPFRVPVYAYDGGLQLSATTVGNAVQPKAFTKLDFGEISIGDSIQSHIILTNRNPVQIAIREFESLVESCILKLEKIEAIVQEAELLTIGEGSKPPAKDKKIFFSFLVHERLGQQRARCAPRRARRGAQVTCAPGMHTATCASWCAPALVILVWVSQCIMEILNLKNP